MWYSAALLLKRTHPEATPSMDDPLWEESIVLIKASGEDEARSEAKRLGMAENASFQAVSGELVSWKFVGVTDVHELGEEDLKHGTELFSRFLRVPPEASART